MKYTTYPLEASDKMQYAVREWNDNTIRFRIDFERAVDRARLKEAGRTLLENMPILRSTLDLEQEAWIENGTFGDDWFVEC